jgi:hypothetical protein
MKLTSLIKKLIIKLKLNTVYNKNLISPNWYIFNLEQQTLPTIIKKKPKILFYFDNVEYMHLGDHVFFLPVVKLLQDNNLSVSVKPTKIMREFFINLGFKIIDGDVNFADYDLIISRVELIEQLQTYPTILIDVAKNLTKPICSELVTSFSQYFKLDNYYQEIDYTRHFNNISSVDKYQLPTKKLILFNLYCDASRYLITKQKRQLLLTKLKQYSNNDEYQLVLVGSKTDKLQDKTHYDFSFIDLRGKTSVVDIFQLVAHANTTYYIGFDAFIMHVFSLNKKTSFVVFRGRISQSQSEMLKKYHVNLFDNDNYVNLLN